MFKQPFHILHLSAARSWRGGEQQLAYLLEALQSKGIRQVVLCPAGSAMAEYCQQQGLDYTTFHKLFSINPLTARKVKQVCGQFGVTHVHTHDSHAHSLAVMAASLFDNRLPIVVHRRVDFPIGRNPWSRWKYNHPMVKRIICVSQFIERLIKPVIKDVGKLAVVHSGIDTARFGQPTQGIPLRQEFRVPEGHFLIGNVAAIAPHKDYPTFLRTAEKLLNQGFPAVFLAIGADGGQMGQVQRLIEEKKLTGKVILTGFRPDLAQLLPQLDLLLFTSKTEGLGTSLLDAFACGVPVVATATGGIPELVEPGITGLLAPVGHAEELADAVCKLLIDHALRERLVGNAHQKVLEFTVAQMAEGVVAQYRKAGEPKTYE